MLTSGNVTGPAAELEREAYVLREPGRWARRQEPWAHELLESLSPAAHRSPRCLVGRSNAPPQYLHCGRADSAAEIRSTDPLEHLQWPCFAARHRDSAAALSFARRALEEGLQRATTRRILGRTLADFQLTQAKLAQMPSTIDGAALLTYRAAWQRDQGPGVTREAAMAELAATEGAQQVIDAAAPLWGGLGVVSGQPGERLHREIRSLRIDEGATEVWQSIIGRDLLRHVMV